MATSANAHSQVRIIGGAWRGRRISFPARAELRPTPDRVRETLFNWLQPSIAGAQCLDLFAGSGALSWEALSRGAGRAVLLDNDTEVLRALRDMQARLQAANAEVIAADALRYLAGTPTRFDIVFLDPPFAADYWDALMNALPPWIAPGGFIYIESQRHIVPALSPQWSLHRSKVAGQVAYQLARQRD